MALHRTYPACGEEYDREADLEHQLEMSAPREQRQHFVSKSDAERGDPTCPPAVDPPSTEGPNPSALPSAVWRQARWRNGGGMIECPTCEGPVEILVSRHGVHGERCERCAWTTTKVTSITARLDSTTGIAVAR